LTEVVNLEMRKCVEDEMYFEAAGAMSAEPATAVEGDPIAINLLPFRTDQGTDPGPAMELQGMQLPVAYENGLPGHAATWTGGIASPSAQLTYHVAWPSICGDHGGDVTLKLVSPTTYPIAGLTATPATISAGATSHLLWGWGAGDPTTQCIVGDYNVVAKRVSDGMVTGTYSSAKGELDVTPTETTDYLVTIACKNSPWVQSPPASVRVTVPTGTGTGTGTPVCNAGVMGFSSVELVNDTVLDDDTLSIWIANNSGYQYLGDISLGEQLTVDLGDCQYNGINAVSWNKVAEQNSTFGTNYDPHDPTVAGTINYWRWSAPAPNAPTGIWGRKSDPPAPSVPIQ
jgi:hypothetical protein